MRQRAGMDGHEADHLGRIHGAAAPQGDEGVAAARLIGLQALLHVLFDGIGMRAVEYRDPDPL